MDKRLDTPEKYNRVLELYRSLKPPEQEPRRVLKHPHVETRSRHRGPNTTLNKYPPEIRDAIRREHLQLLDKHRDKFLQRGGMHTYKGRFYYGLLLGGAVNKVLGRIGRVKETRHKGKCRRRRYRNKLKSRLGLQTPMRHFATLELGFAEFIRQAKRNSQQLEQLTIPDNPPINLEGVYDEAPSMP